VKATVTGATGYIGRRLVTRLVDEGWTVLALVLPGDDTPLPEGVIRREDPGDAPAAAEIQRRFRPDIVLHLAACQELGDEPDTADRLLEANIAFGARVLAAAAASEARGLVAAGTFMAHADGTREYVPQNLYAATKQAFRDLAAHYSRWRGLPVTILELSDTYGPDDVRPKFLNLLSQASRRGEVLDATPGEQIVYPLHVDDVVDAFLFTATQMSRGIEFAESYTLSGPTGVSLRQLVALYGRATGDRPAVRFGGLPYRRNEVMSPYVGASLPGWTPSVSLEDGLREVFGGRAVPVEVP
jgi:nucleoside-diphosphate-sugar epimerase